MTVLNYYFILNGTQLLNAVEYIHKMNIKNEENILVLLCETDFVWDDLNKVLDQNNEWIKIIQLFPMWMMRLNNSNFIRIFSVIYSKFKLKQLLRLNTKRIILGNYNNVYCKYIAKRNKKSELILVDDGIGTLDFFGNHKKQSSKIKSVFEIFLKVKRYKIIPTTIFTRYYKQLEQNNIVNKIDIVPNTFTYLKESIKHKHFSPEKLFVGYAIIEENILDLNEYIQLLLSIKEQNGNFAYVPHRREKEENIKLISNYFVIKNLEMPFELYLYKTDNCPSEIVGFFSTVLFNVNEMFGSKIALKYVKLRNLKISQINNLDNLYKELSLVADELFEYNIESNIISY